MRTLLRIGAVLATVIVIAFLATATLTLQRQNAQADEATIVLPEAAQTAPRVAMTTAQANVTRIAPSHETQIVLKATVIEIDGEKLAQSGLSLGDFIPQTDESQADAQPDEIRNTTFTAREAELFTNLIRATKAAKIVAEPTVIAAEGRPASFHSGGEFPIPLPQDAGKSNIEYRKFGTSVDYSAITLPDGVVRVAVKLEQAEIDQSRSITIGGTNVPGLRKRQIDTTFEVEAGKTVVLYGKQDETLVIMITPEVVAPIGNNPPLRQSAPFETPVAGQSQTLPGVATAPRARPQATKSTVPTIAMTTLVYRLDAKAMRQGGFDLNLGEALLPTLENLDKKRQLALTIDARKMASLAEDLTEIPGVYLLSRPQVIAPSGTSASVQVGQRIVLPNLNDDAQFADDEHHVGLDIQLLPESLGDNKIQLSARVVHSWLDGNLRSLGSSTLSEKADLFFGETLVVYDHDDEDFLIFVTPRILGSETPTYPSPDYADAAQQAAPPQPAGTAGRPVAKSPQQPNQVASSNTEDQRLKQLSQHFGPDHPQVVEQRTRVEARERQQARQAEIHQKQEREKWHRSVDEFEQVSLELFPDADVKLREIGTGVIISGTVSSSEQARVLSAIAEGLFPNVINNLRTVQIKNEAQIDSGEQLQEVLAELFPNSQLRVRPLNNSVVLSGELDEKLAQQAVRIAEDFYPQVLDHTKPPRTSASGIAVQPAPATPAPEALAPVWREPVQSAAESSSIGGELRALHEDVRVLRRDVSRLIEILEDRDEPATNALPTEGGQSSSVEPNTDEIAWQLIGIRIEKVEVNSEKFRGGLKILEVRSGSPAETEGFRLGDVLVGLDKWEVIDLNNVDYVFSHLNESASDELTVHLLRGTHTLVGHLKLESLTTSEIHREVWNIPLDRAIAIGLQNSKPIRKLGGVIPFARNGEKPVVVSRVNKDVSIHAFEIAVRDSVGDVKAKYWELWAAKQKLDHAREARSTSQTLWNRVRSSQEDSDANQQDEVKAREHYFYFRDQLQTALKEFYEHEAELRSLLGLAKSDGKLICAMDEPTDAQITIDWSKIEDAALKNNADVRQQRQAVTQAELELAAATKSLQPGMDLLKSYGLFGDESLGIELSTPVGSRQATSRLRNAQLRLKLEQARLKDVELNTSHLLTTAVREVEMRYQAAQTAAVRRIEAEREVQSATVLYEDGKSTLPLILDGQRRIAESKADYADAIAEYATALKEVHRLQGSLLAEHNLAVEEAKEIPAAESDTTNASAIPDPTVALKPGDRLTIESLVDGTLNRHITILPDGTVTLPLLGQVKAAGHTLAELHEDLDMRYSKHYKEPSLLVSFFGTSISSDGDASDLLIKQASQQLDPKSELTPGTALMIESLVDSKLNRRVIILADGTISLPLIGQVNTNGMTIGKLRAELGKAYKKFYKEVLLTLSFAGTSIPSKHEASGGPLGERGTLVP